MSLFVRGMEMPKSCWECDIGPAFQLDDKHCPFYEMEGQEQENYQNKIAEGCPISYVPPHGRLIDADKLHEAMYHRAFETDGDTMWQSGCWVRYRAIEQVQDSQPTIIEAEG